MSLALLSVLFLFLAIVLACLTPLNIGIIGFALAFITFLISKMPISNLIACFPTDLVITLIGVTYFFSIARVNGTLDWLSKFSMKLVRGRVALLPWIFFIISYVISGIGPGVILTTAMLAPMAMFVASYARISPVLMIIMLVHGGHAISYSPVSILGVIANGVLIKQGLPLMTGTLILNNTIVHLMAAIAGYIIFGGLKLWKTQGQLQTETGSLVSVDKEQSESMNFRHILTLILMLTLLIIVVVFKVQLGFTAIILGIILALTAPKNEEQVIKVMPWHVITLVAGIMTLIGFMEKVGGLKLIGENVGQFTNSLTMPLVLSYGSAFVSFYASSGIVLVTFVTIAKYLADVIPGVNIFSAVSAIAVSDTIVDSSPLSAAGAMGLAGIQDEKVRQTTFRQLILWGVSMLIIGPLVAWLLFVVFRLP